MAGENTTNEQSVAAALQSAAAAINLATKSHDTFASIAKEKEAQTVSIALIKNDIQYIKSDMAEINGSMKAIREDFVTHIEFNESIKLIQEQMRPLKNIVYGLVGAIMLAVIAGILNLVIH